ncbi:putative ATP-dependent RNA helicase DDX47 [Tritrichomonas foetus]|uniref:ATP-dependent RNA helicase DDX47 n=1 Tax=Tritrichomonas foetus TaxID=1144522 RepID=A0A1J4K8J6_9EUKA|nr:putative ATP-dependent RNA helicase DDX47 [Tritrichomonas foetus]|eukprot:OHT07727.1 putative ATP-dependent RNA helicase DDX47 [Tritrichomonas foetus]
MADENQVEQYDDSITFYDLGLCKEMVDACTRLGWKVPTPIQAKTIPPALNKKDVCGMAETGSGKTGAFALPIYHHLLENQKEMYALVLEPTHELVLQVADVFRQLGEEIGAKVIAITGGVDERSQVKLLEKKPHIIVATTGRLNQIMREKPNINFKTIRALVFDEADRMLSDSFLSEVKTILARIGNNHQSFLFSATLPDEIENLIELSLNQPETFALSKNNETASTLTESVVVAPTNKKEAVLFTLLKELNDKTCVIFTGMRKTAHIVTKMLQTLRKSAVLYHGKLQQKQRQKAVEDFKNGKFTILVATNVASRGLDIPHVSTVINYDLPETSEEYVHRVGRAGRATRCGNAITIITMNDLPAFKILEGNLKHKLDLKRVDDDDVAQVAEEVEQARKAGVESFKEYSKQQKQKFKNKK